MSQHTPAYLRLGLEALRERARIASERLVHCDLCPRLCHVNRLQDETGVCGVGARAPVASYNLHFGEEAPLVDEGGSGTIFFSGCNLLCVFCQNIDISHAPQAGHASDGLMLAQVMLELQSQGALNINFVTPSHVIPQILAGVVEAAERGLRLPLVYNSSGYDMPDSLAMLEGVVDIYMPDVKFWEQGPSKRYLNAPDYPERARAAVLEMHRQVGDLELDENGAARRGLLVRHLVMPGGTAGTAEWMRFLAQEISANTYVNLMNQYRPCGRASEHPEIAHPLPAEDYDAALQAAHDAGITRLDERPQNVLRHLMRMLGGDEESL